jgi:large subunit ribosomal protein L9
MEVVLKEDVGKVGLAGEKVRVANGYGRNFLIPQGLALEATDSNLKILEFHMKDRAKKLAAQKGEAEAMAAEIAKLHISFTRKAGEEGKLFGSVTASEIGRVVVKKGFQIDRRKILLDMPIKQLGEHEVKIKLHPEVTGTITVEIKAEEPEPDLTAEPAEEKEETEE